MYITEAGVDHTAVLHVHPSTTTTTTTAYSSQQHSVSRKRKLPQTDCLITNHFTYSRPLSKQSILQVMSGLKLNTLAMHATVRHACYWCMLLAFKLMLTIVVFFNNLIANDRAVDINIFYILLHDCRI